MPAELRRTIERDGYAILAAALSPPAVRSIALELEQALESADSTAGPIRTSHAMTAASRNLLKLWPGILDLARAPAIRDALAEVLGPSCGLVRALYFDKPPGQSWSLPWHKDMTIAVRNHRLGGAHFTKPTMKSGVPHVEAPESVLGQMLTARIHLDDVTEDNGPLLVVPGSHREGKAGPADSSNLPFQPVLVAAGDVLLMRPLVTHCSRKSVSITRRRRVIHLEFAAAAPLPDGYQWYEFHPLVANQSERPT